MFKFEGTCITDPFLDETGRFPVNPLEYYISWPLLEGHKMSLSILTDIYEKYCKKEKIPCIDAWEYLFDDSSLTPDQNKWIRDFSKVWEYIEIKEGKQNDQRYYSRPGDDGYHRWSNLHHAAVRISRAAEQ